MMASNTATARLRELSVNANGIMRAITASANEVAQEAEQSRKAYQELLAKHRALQRDCDLLKAGAGSVDPENAPEPYVIVLVDAHSHMFHRDLLTAGTPGGSKAAKQLREAVQEYLKQVFPDNRPCRIVIRVFANLKSLSATVLDDNNRALSGFANGLCWVDPFFDFIDVGNEEHVKARIVETLRVSLRDPQCQHVFFAACADARYTNVLLSCPNIKIDVSLISGTSDDSSMLPMRLKCVAFPRVFNSGKSAQSPNRALWFGICWDFEVNNCVRKSCVFEHIRTSEMCTNVSNPSPWCDLVERTREPASGLPLEPVEGMIPVNAVGHRLDIRRPWPGDELWARFQTRTKIKKLCTTYHLQKSCDNALCEYDHSRIDPAMRKCLEYWAGHFKCTQNGSCRIEKCFKSHICQWPRCLSKGGARSSSCQYPLRMHGVDFKVHEWVPAGNGIKDYGSDGSDSLIRDMGRSFHGSANGDEEVAGKAGGRDDFGGGVVYDLIDL